MPEGSERVAREFSGEDYETIKSLDALIEYAKKSTPFKDIYETKKIEVMKSILEIRKQGLDIYDFVKEKIIRAEELYELKKPSEVYM